MLQKRPQSRSRCRAEEAGKLIEIRHLSMKLCLRASANFDKCCALCISPERTQRTRLATTLPLSFQTSFELPLQDPNKVARTGAP
jgi:hypothetical protein